MENCPVANAPDGSMLEAHQLHRLPGFEVLKDGRRVNTGGYQCTDVIAMEVSHGRHAETCSWVGYIGAKGCGCIK